MAIRRVHRALSGLLRDRPRRHLPRPWHADHGARRADARTDARAAAAARAAARSRATRACRPRARRGGAVAQEGHGARR
eukprot:5205284-Prymnesium_polylepis.1